MKRAQAAILLLSVPGLMFCIIPVNGMEYVFSWQLAALSLAGIVFALWLRSWWWRIFFLLALFRTATMEPSYDAYISLLTIAVFLAAAEGFSRIHPQKTMDMMCVGSVLLLIWMVAQRTGAMTAHFAERSAGPFNPDAGGVFLALCLPAFFRIEYGAYLPFISMRFRRRWSTFLLHVPEILWPRWIWFLPFITWGLWSCCTTTGAIAALAAAGAFAFRTVQDKRKLAATAVAILLMTGIWFWRVDPFEGVMHGNRWIAWKHAAWSLQAEQYGRGLGSWKVIFPLLASGDTRIGAVTNENGTITISNAFREAHNEYVQATFELGLQALALILAFAAFAVWRTLRGSVSAHAAAGIAALFVACFGWHVFHVGPLALIGCAWLGIWEGRIRQ